jgi:hypothetical protein
MPYYITPPPMNTLSRLLAAILAVLALVGAFFFGVFILVLAAGLGLAAWLYLSLRLWWIRKKRGAGTERDVLETMFRSDGQAPDERGGKVIDAEYTVVSREDEES